MAISIDALLAIMLFIALVAFISVEPVSNLPLTQSTIVINQIVDDAIAAVDSTGFIMEIVENTSGKTKAELEADMQQKLEGLLPEKVEFRVEMQQYSSNLDDPASTCRAAASDFDDCFPDAPTEYIATGNAVPTDQEVFHGRKIFIKKEPGDCDLITLKEKAEKEPILAFENEKEEFTILRFQGGPEICDNSLDDDEDTLFDCNDPDCMMFPACINMSFTFTSTVTVGGTQVDEISCDETAVVELRIEREANTRLPVDIIFAASKNHSMAECMIAAGRLGGTLVNSGETGITRGDFTKVVGFDFDVTAADANAFDAALSWTDACSPNCPEFRLKSPTGIIYGEGQATTQLNSRACNEENVAVIDKAGQSQRAYYYNNRTYYRYLALGSALVNPPAETGIWEVWVKNTVPTDYSLKVKYIDNNHWVAGTPDAEILPWDEPISKIDTAKVLITEFANRADWKVEDQDVDKRDEYAYAEIGLPQKVPVGTGSNIQPNSGLQDARDIGPPIGSQLKNIDIQIASIPGPAYFYILREPGLINEELTKRPEWAAHTKFAIIYGDSSDDSQGAYTKQEVIDDADGNGIFYYSIDLSNELIPGNDTCQNQDLYDLGWDTGGMCYAAMDESALDAILDIVAIEIGDRAGIDPDPVTSTLALDYPDDFQYSFFNGSITHPHTWDTPTSTLTFNNITILNGLWSTDFDLLVPCDFTDCEDFFSGGKSIDVPPSDTNLYYEIDGAPQDQVSWPVEQITTVLLKFRDLMIEFIAGYFYGVNEVSVEYEVSNVGYFDVDLADVIPTVNFYTADLPAEACDPLFRTGPIGIDNLTGIVDAAFPAPGPDTSERAIKGLGESGHLCLYLNELQSVSECSGNNAVVVQCEVPKTVVYVLDYWAWEK